MKKLFFVALALIFTDSIFAQPSPTTNYDNYFTNDRLRIDLNFAGDSESLYVFLESLSLESNWAGPKTSIIDPFNRGDHYMKVFSEDDNLLYSRGFNTLFREWRTTAEAKTVAKSAPTSLWIPFPKGKVRVVIYDKPKATGSLKEMLSFEVDPKDKLIRKKEDTKSKTTKIIDNGTSDRKVDILFLAEGYRATEMDKFRADIRKMTDYMFEMEPYKSRKSDFNVWAVETISQDTGTDIPQDDVWKNTAFNSHFYTFYIDRYLTLPSQTELCDAISGVPCDAIYVIVNTEKYGGGGMFNFYGIATSDNKHALPVFIHEFGHSFAGLADEYYNSATAYEEFYNLKVEPWEPNITTNVDFASKWKSMILPSTPLPTPAEEFYGTKTVGLFEGGGYMAKGIYRSAFNCRMRTNTADGFCTVCQKAINDMIDYYIGGVKNYDNGYKQH